jgi:hypothetical protein
MGVDHLHSSVVLMGGGVTLIDVNGDNLIDVYLTGGQDSHDRLFLNLGNDKFLDVSDSSGIKLNTINYTTFGVISGEVNNDGCDDLFVTTHDDNEKNILMLGDCKGNFITATEGVGINETSSSTSAAFVDFNNDGNLDIYVLNYTKLTDFIRDENDVVIGFNHECYPNYLYLNNGNGTFSEVAEEYNVADIGCGLAVTTSDFDLDGDPDIYVANDFGEWVAPNGMYQNNGEDGFVDVSQDTGLDARMYGMGIAPADYDNDGDIDYYVTNIGANVLLVNDGNQVFEDQAALLGVDNTLSEKGTNATSWGAIFCDFDNDGFKDLYVANGYIAAAPFLNNTLQDDNKLYLNSRGNTFTDVSADYGLNSILINRGVAYGDINNDGLMDIISASVVKTDNGNGSANVLLYINNSSSEANWLQVKLEGTVSNRNAFGSIVEVYADNTKYIQEKLSGGSHASQNTDILHFGLANIQSIDSIKIRWPSGSKTLLKDVSTKQRILIIEDSDEYNVIDCNLGDNYRCYNHNTLGCMDIEALNYNMYAVTDDGSCNYESAEITGSQVDVPLERLAIYPNPFSTLIEINSDVNLSLKRITITGLSGKVHYEQILDIGTTYFTIDASTLKSGVYICELMYESSESDIRLITKY